MVESNPDAGDSLGRRPAEYEALLAALSAGGVDYLVAGGVAVIFQGYVRYTQDLDIIPSPDASSLTRLAEVLRELEAVMFDARRERVSPNLAHPESLAVGNYFLETRFGALDLFNGPHPDLKRYRQLEDRAREVDVKAHKVKVVSKDDLIAMKREAGRPKDLRDIAALTEVERNP